MAKRFTLEVLELKKLFEKEIINHERLIYKICRIYASTEADREDLFQDIIIQLWHSYPRFKGQSKFSTWLYRVAINTCITQLRKKKDFLVYHEPAELPTQVSDENILEQQEERVQLLYTAIGKLNDIEKAIIMLYMDDHSYDDMEEILGISNATLRVKMNRIKEKLRNLTKAQHYGN